MGALGLVANDRALDAALAGVAKEFHDSWECRRLADPLPVGGGLEQGPVLRGDRRLDAALGRRQIRGDQPPLDRQPVQERVVADDGVVEVDADQH